MNGKGALVVCRGSRTGEQSLAFFDRLPSNPISLHDLAVAMVKAPADGLVIGRQMRKHLDEDEFDPVLPNNESALHCLSRRGAFDEIPNGKLSEALGQIEVLEHGFELESDGIVLAPSDASENVVGSGDEALCSVRVNGHKGAESGSGLLIDTLSLGDSGGFISACDRRRALLLGRLGLGRLLLVRDEDGVRQRDVCAQSIIIGR